MQDLPSDPEGGQVPAAGYDRRNPAGGIAQLGCCVLTTANPKAHVAHQVNARCLNGSEVHGSCWASPDACKRSVFVRHRHADE